MVVIFIYSVSASLRYYIVTLNSTYLYQDPEDVI